MKMFVCCIRDMKTDVFSQPMFFVSTGAAIRAFSDEVNRLDEKSMFYNHPGDFDIFHVALFDDSSGAFVNVEPVLRLAEGGVLKVRN